MTSEFNFQVDDVNKFVIININKINQLKNNVIDKIINKLNTSDYLSINNDDLFRLQDLVNQKKAYRDDLYNKSKKIYEGYNLGNLNLDNMQLSINKIIMMNKKIRCLWELITDKDVKEDFNKSYELVNFIDLFESINNIDNIHSTYISLQNYLLCCIDNEENPILNILESKINNNKKYKDYIPIKDKFSTEQLTNNYECLYIDLQKFSQFEFNDLTSEEITELLLPYQIKIKKFQVISRELQNRFINNNIENNNLINNLYELSKPKHHIDELNETVINFINDTNNIINKWRLLQNIVNYKNQISTLDNEILDIENKINQKNQHNLALLEYLNTLKNNNSFINVMSVQSVNLLMVTENKINQLINNQEIIINQNNQLLNNNEEQLDVVEEPSNITEEQLDVVEEPSNITEEQLDVVEEPSNITEEQLDVVEEPSNTLPNFEKVASFKEALDKYNNSDNLIKQQTLKTYLCIACNKTLSYNGSKPDIHCKTIAHSKQFIKWVNNNNIL
jgi:hypothetical protein